MGYAVRLRLPSCAYKVVFGSATPKADDGPGFGGRLIYELTANANDQLK
jgi:hypothetical protein